MKKKYIKPAIGKGLMCTSELLTASLNHVDGDQAAAGGTDNTVNYGRRGSFWEDTE